MFKRTALVATTAVAAALLLAAPANAEVGYNLDANLGPGKAIGLEDGTWVVTPGDRFFFGVGVVNTGPQYDTDLSVFVSVPFEVTGYSGDGWECQDVDGGVRCSIPDLVVRDEQWPLLQIDGIAGPDTLQDSVDIYAESRHGDVHAGVPFEIRDLG